MPGRMQSPDTEISLLPVDCGVPSAVKAAGPRSAMRAAQAKVSTLFTTVGWLR